MDGLSVAASVVGLLTAAAQMTTLLYSLGSEFKDAPELAQSAANELNDISVVLTQLQRYIERRAQASQQRLGLITVEHITATLTGCVLTYSELDALLKSLHVDTGLRKWDRAKWILKKDQVYLLISRLQNHKSSLSLMLNIMQCESQSEAETSMDRLCDLMNQVLHSDRRLSLRLRNIEGLSAAKEIANQESSDPLPAVDAVEGAVAEPEPPVDASSNSGAESRSSTRSYSFGDDNRANDAPKISAFEEVLTRSRVYRHVAGSHSESSLPLEDDGRSTLAFSIYSSETLGEVSNISVFAIPVYAKDLSNAECYSFTRSLKPVERSAPSTPGSAKLSGPGSPKASSGESRSSASRSPWWKPRSKKEQKPLSPGIQTANGHHIFGVPLTTSEKYANVAISLWNDKGEQYIYGYIPIVVAKCAVLLKEKAHEPNLLGESSSPLVMHRLEQIFDSPPRFGKELSWSDYSVHDAANIFIRYILRLPEPVIPLAFYHQFRDPLRGHQAQAVGAMPGQQPGDLVTPFDASAAIVTYQGLITVLPPLHRHFLLYLLDMCAVFAYRSEVNLMTTPRMAATLQAGILAHPDHVNDALEVRLSQDVLIFLIENQDSFLVGMYGGGAAATSASAQA